MSLLAWFDRDFNGIFKRAGSLDRPKAEHWTPISIDGRHHGVGVGCASNWEPEDSATRQMGDGTRIPVEVPTRERSDGRAIGDSNSWIY